MAAQAAGVITKIKLTLTDGVRHFTVHNPSLTTVLDDGNYVYFMDKETEPERCCNVFMDPKFLDALLIGRWDSRPPALESRWASDCIHQ